MLIPNSSKNKNIVTNQRENTDNVHTFKFDYYPLQFLGEHPYNILLHLIFILSSFIGLN